MKKNELVWRLKSKPTFDEIQSLLDKKVITKDEARQLLFSENDTTAENKALKEQVKFLEGVVERLSDGNRNPVIVREYVERFTPRYPQYWLFDNGFGTFTTTQGTTAYYNTLSSSTTSSNTINS